jgi:hypothetical protein
MQHSISEHPQLHYIILLLSIFVNYLTGSIGDSRSDTAQGVTLFGAVAGAPGAPN